MSPPGVEFAAPTMVRMKYLGSVLAAVQRDSGCARTLCDSSRDRLEDSVGVGDLARHDQRARGPAKAKPPAMSAE